MKALITDRDIEALAAFVDGRLAPEEHAAVVARLAADEGYDELLREVLAFRDVAIENEAVLPEPVGPAPTATPKPGFAEFLRGLLSPGFAVPVFAAVILAFVGWQVWLSQRPPRLEELITALGQKSSDIRPEDLTGLPWTMRSGEPTSSFEVQSLQLGVRLIDWRIALERGDRKLAADRATEVKRQLDRDKLKTEPKIAEILRDIDEGRVEADVVDRLDALLPRFYDEASYREGLLLRAAYFAAETGQRDFFTPKVERLLTEAGSQPTDDLPARAESLWELLRRRGRLE